MLSANLFLSTGNRSIPVLPGIKIRPGAGGELAGRIIAKPSEPTVLLIQNLSETPWNITTPTGRTVSVEPRGFCPAKENLRITMMSDNLPLTLTVKPKQD